MDMAEAFNLNTFLQTYQQNTYDPTNLHATAEENMEQKLITQAENAVKESSFLTLTLSEKIAELGVGKRVLEQISDTATNFSRSMKTSLTKEFTTRKFNLTLNKCSSLHKQCKNKPQKTLLDKNLYTTCNF